MTIALTVIDPAGTHHALVAEEGISLMEVIRSAGLDGITAECNGNAACATCHVYCDPPAPDALPAPGAQEADMLEFTAAPSLPGSRLSCQVLLSAALAGLVVTIPDTQV